MGRDPVRLRDPATGVYPGPDPGGDQELELVEFRPPENGTVDPVLISEVLYVIAKLFRRP